MGQALQETFYCGSESSVERAIRTIRAAPLFDDKDRQLVVIIKRARGDQWNSKNRRFHAYVNLLADYKDIPAPALKEAFKARFCPLVENVDPISGEISHHPKGVSDCSEEELQVLCEKVVRFVGDEWQLPLPTSEEEWSICKYGGLEALQELRANMEERR